MEGGSTTGLQVLIIGAGTTGLLLAQGLTRAGIKATVFEREIPGESRKYQREWSMSLHWGGKAIEKLLPPELYARINEAFVDPSWKPTDSWTLHHWDGSTGEILMNTEMPVGAMRVSRKRMRKFFSEGVDVHYGKSLVSITQDETSVTAIFEDGTKVVGSVLLGCDGGRSIVRRLLVGNAKAEPTDLNISVTNFPLKFEADLARRVKEFHPIAFNTYHPKNWMFWVSTVEAPDPEKPESWLFQLMLFWTGSPRKDELPDQASRTQFIKSKANEYVEPWKSIFGAIPNDVNFGVDHIHEWQPFDWASSPLANRVTLAGDASHTMTPYRGQGLNSGLEDAAVLSELLIKADATPEGVQAALRSYEAEMIPRSSLEVQISSKTAAMAHNYKMLMESPIVKLGVRKSRNEDFQ